MAKRFVIDIFTPPQFNRYPLDIERLNNLCGKNFIYASMGRWALYHILCSLKISGKILIPVYLCDSVLVPVKILKIEPVFYDIDQNDLNGSLESIEFLVKKFSVKTVLIASLYGNPANLMAIENFCKENEIKLIDDAAQSFGAKLDGRFVGTFGNAGFFSFSPGKATAGHLGSFFWAENQEYNFTRKVHCLFHKFIWWDFYFNRLYRYKYHKYKIFSCFSLFKKITSKIFDIKYDDICEFEKNILGGILHSFFEGAFSFRQKYFQEFIQKFSQNEFFNIIKPLRGGAVNHKIVLLFKTIGSAIAFRKYLKCHQIYCSSGYRMLSDDFTYLPVARNIARRIVEIPIENDQDRMNYLFEIVGNFQI